MADSNDSNVGDEVGVEQAALMKILARYPGSFDVLRELIQNADDAEAKNIEVHYLTGEADESQSVSEPDANDKPRVWKWIIKNGGGKLFEEEDWDRIGSIAKGNDNTTKVGAFGVGFYSVLSKTDEPFVMSGGKSLQFRFGKDGKLRKQFTDCPSDEWTSIEVKLRDPEPLPEFDELTRFLVSSLAFLANVCTISIHLEGRDEPLCVKREASQDPAATTSISIPPHLNQTTLTETLTVDSIQRTEQKIIIDAPDWALVSTSALASASPPDVTDDTIAERSRRSGANNPTRTPRAANGILKENTIVHDLYMAAISVKLRPEMKKGVESITSKSLPPSFNCKVVYFNCDQHESLECVHSSPCPKAKQIAGLFSGPQGILPQNNSGRLFIGQSTNQTTGIGLHISAHFLPTMERGTIDFANGYVKAWNEEVLWVGGILARIIYEDEMHKAAKSKEDLATWLGLSTMARFAFGSTAPHSGVSQILQEAFFSCGRDPWSPFPVVCSKAGILCASDPRFRQSNRDLSFLKEYPVLHKDAEDRQISQALINRYKIPRFSYTDIIEEFHSGVPLDALNSFFNWWETARSNSQESDKAKVEARERFCAKFASRSILQLSNGGEIALKDIKTYTFFPLPDDLSPPYNLYIDNTPIGVPSKGALECFGWTQLSLLEWLKYARSMREHAPNQTDIDYRILRVLVQFSLVEDLMRQRSQVTELVKDLQCIPTNMGWQIPAESYFFEADICGILPVVLEDRFQDIPSVPDDRGITSRLLDRDHVRMVLTCIRVRQTMDWNIMVDKLETVACEESNFRLLLHLLRLQFGAIRGETLMERQIDSLKQRQVFFSQGHGGVSATELHFPDDAIRQLGLPILDLSQERKTTLQAIADQSEVENFLKYLGIREYPTLENVIRQAASNKPEVHRAALQYLLSNLDKRYGDYKADNFANVAFIPTRQGTLARLNEVFTSCDWEELGFKQVPDESRRLLSRLGVEEDPSVDTIMKCFESAETTLPDLKTATTWFGKLYEYGKLPNSKLREQFATIRFVPVEKPGMHPSESPVTEYLSPKECFISSSSTKEHYHDIFPFVDFGPNGNRFLESCCAKKSPDASDIARKILQDPKKYLSDLKGDTKLYLEDLRTIASGLDSVSVEDKGKMKTTAMFLAFQNDAQKLLLPNQVLVGDWESHYFRDSVFLAPKDDAVEKMYCEMGSQFLGTHVRLEIIPKGQKKEEPPLKSDYIIPRIRGFMSQLSDKNRRKDGVSFYEEGAITGFQINVCRSLGVKKIFAPPFGILTGANPARTLKHGPFQRKAGFEFNDTTQSYTLWMVRCDDAGELRNDIAVALCHGLLKKFGPNDVLLLASLFTTNDNDLKQYYGYDVMDDLPCAPDPAMMIKEPRHFALPFVKSSWGSIQGFRSTGKKIVSEPFENDVDDVVESLGKIDPGAQLPDFTSRCKQPTSSHLKYSSRCGHAHSIRLREDNAFKDNMTNIRFFFSTDAQCRTPPVEAVQEFAKLISDLARVFGQEPSTFCFIFWKDCDEDLMAFNRDQRYLFFNLAHYYRFFYRQGKEENDVVTGWYLIMAHEIAHNKAPEHDGYHASLSERIVAKYLPSLRRSVLQEV